MNSFVHAGYALDGYHELIAGSGRIGSNELRALWSACCSAEAETGVDLSGRKRVEDGVLLAASNIISRGLPTMPSIPMHERFTRAFNRSRLLEDGEGRLRPRIERVGPAFAAAMLEALRAAAPIDAVADPAAGKAAALLASPQGREVLQLMLSPIGAGRVQKALVLAVLAGLLDMTAPAWKLAVIERDVPCAALAIAELRRLLSLLFALEGKGRSLPPITLTVLSPEPFAASPLHAEDGVTIVRDAAALPAGDILIDVAVLRRNATPQPTAAAGPHITLRAAGTGREERRVFVAESPPLKGLYADGGMAVDEAVSGAVRELLADIFRVSAPTDTHMRMIDHALAQRSFIAALPATAGKSLAVQFAALLHPALSFVIVPDAGKAEAQCARYVSAGIDAVVCLHERMRAGARHAARQRFREGHALVLLVTAELFRGEETADMLEQLRGETSVFSQCVIEDAHMLSERAIDHLLTLQRAPAYAARRLYGGKKKSVALRLLTPTTSRDVVADLRQQLAVLGGAYALGDAQCLIPSGFASIGERIDHGFNVAEATAELKRLREKISALQTVWGDAEREKQITHDLLREITYPEDSNSSRIANLISDEFGIELRVGYWQRGLEERMYVQHAADTVGHIDLVTQEIVVDPAYADGSFAREILDTAFGIALEAAGSGPSISSWVAANFPSDVDDGIARQLQDFEAGATFTLRMGYENDRETLLTKIHHILWHQAEIEIQRKLLSEIRAGNWTEFRSQLAERTGRGDLFAALDPALEKSLIQLYNKIRMREDTERFMYRLGVLGVAQDYVQHPSSKRFSLRVAVRGEHEIREALARHLGLFMTAKQADDLLAPLYSYSGDSLLEQVLEFLIDHIAEDGRARRDAQAQSIDTILREAVGQGEHAFRESLHLAANAKYALRWRLPAALGSNPTRIRLFAEYLGILETDRSASIRENAEHLRASCDVLAPSHPGEAGLLLLRAFAELVNAGKSALPSARKQFASAFAAAAAADGLEGESFVNIVSKLERTLQRYFDDDECEQLLSLLRDETVQASAAAMHRVNMEKAAAEKAAAEKAAAEKAAAEKAAAEKAAAEKAAAKKAVAEKAVAEKAAAEKAAAEKAAAEKAAAEKAVAEKAVAEKAAAEKAAAEKAAAEKAAAGKASTDTASTERGGMAPSPEAVAGTRPKANGRRPEVTNLGDAVNRAAQAAPPEPDPDSAGRDAAAELVTHLNWLKSFNNNFLKHYES